MQQNYTPHAPKRAGVSGAQRPRSIFLSSATCEVCGATFKPRKEKLRFCSRACYFKWATGNPNSQSPNSLASLDAELVGDDLEPIITPELETEDDVSLWELRSRYWELNTETNGDRPLHYSQRTYATRSPKEPIILAGHGVQLKINGGSLLIKDGFTHYPQERKEWRLFPGAWEHPSRIVLLDTNGYLTVDVISWLAEQNIPLVVLNWRGQSIGVLSNESGSVEPRIRKAQYLANTNGCALRLANELIKSKLAKCREVLFDLPDTGIRQEAIDRIDDTLAELNAGVVTKHRLLLVEGRAAAAYFDVWQSIQLKWKGLGKHPIPMDWMFVGRRNSLVSGSNRSADHPANAILNYAYGILESQVRIAAIAVGLDPSVGVLHASRPGRAALIYDLMEAFRPDVDKQVLNLLRSEAFTPADFLVTPSGYCRLNPQLGKRVAGFGCQDSAIRDSAMQLVQGLLS